MEAINLKSFKLFILVLVLALVVLLGAYFNINSIDFVREHENGFEYSNNFEIETIDIVENTDIENPCLCPERYDPVCGRDGITYPNICFAECKNIPIVRQEICN
jgi:hypothetical protein